MVFHFCGLAIFAAAILPSALATCPTGYTSYFAGWCLSEVTKPLSYDLAKGYCMQVNGGRLIHPSRIQQISDTEMTVDGVHRTAGRWNFKRNFWFDGVSQFSRMSTQIIDFGAYIMPAICETEHPKRNTLAWDNLTDSFVPFNEDTPLPFICEAPAAAQPT